MYFNSNLISKQKLIVADGLAGGGKILISNLLAGLPKVDQWFGDYITEQICALVYLKKIDLDIAVNFLKNNYNKVFFESVILRHSNLRKSDKSSFQKHPRYKSIKGRLKDDDQKVFANFKGKVIVHFLTHFISNYSEPIFKSFKKQLLFISMLRSPLNVSMINHLAKWSIKWEGNVSRDGILRIWHNNYKKNFPFFIKNQTKEYLEANKYEKAILIISSYLKKTSKIKKFEKKYGSKIILIPFENLITNPTFYLNFISKNLSVKQDLITKYVLKKNIVPRNFDLSSHDQEGIKFIRDKVSKKYLNELISLNNFYHKPIIQKY